MTQFCSKYWQIFQNLVSWTTFCICRKSLADKRLVNNLIRGNLLSFPTYTKGQSMNWGKDSQLLLQISQTSPFAAHRVRENCLMLHMSWIFLVGMFSFPRLVESLTVTMRDLIYFDWVLIQLAALRAPIKSERTFFKCPPLEDENEIGVWQKLLGTGLSGREKGLQVTQALTYSTFISVPPSLQFNAQLECYKWLYH